MTEPRATYTREDEERKLDVGAIYEKAKKQVDWYKEWGHDMVPFIHIDARVLLALCEAVMRMREAIAEAVSHLQHAPNTNNYDFEKWRLDWIEQNRAGQTEGDG